MHLLTSTWINLYIWLKISRTKEKGVLSFTLSHGKCNSMPLTRTQQLYIIDIYLYYITQYILDVSEVHVYALWLSLAYSGNRPHTVSF